MATEQKITCSNIWKLFGPDEKRIIKNLDKNLSIKEVQEKTGHVVAVKDVSFSIQKGETFVVMGLSGSGKSTLVRHINRLLEPTSGQIIVDGVDVCKLNTKKLEVFRNRKIGMVFQNFGLLPHRSVLDNIAMPLEIRSMNKNHRLEIANKILTMVELDGWGNKFAHELSGGMQQRVGLARALAADPDVLLMDEPFSALDPLIRRQLQDEFIKLASQMNKTTVFITHDLDEAVRVGNRIAIMRDGRIVQIGTAEEILTNPADKYVADFVAGISRLKVVRAETLMEDFKSSKKNNLNIKSSKHFVDINENLTNIIKCSIKDKLPIVVMKKNKKVGFISREKILKTVIDGTETS